MRETLAAGRKGVNLLEGFQASPARPSGRNIKKMEVKRDNLGRGHPVGLKYINNIKLFMY
jgi:hypothetical protein